MQFSVVMTMCTPSTLQLTKRRGASATLLSCGALLALATAARAHDSCTYAHFGYLEGRPVDLPVTYLTPGLADWRVTVPVPLECGGAAAGYQALVCDYSAPPLVHAGRGELRVRRSPSPAGYATVQLTAYCEFFYPPAGSPPPPPPPPLPLHNMINMLPAVPNRSQNLSGPAPALPSIAPVPEQTNDLISSSYDEEEESVEESEEETEDELDEQPKLSHR